MAADTYNQTRRRLDTEAPKLEGSLCHMVIYLKKQNKGLERGLSNYKTLLFFQYSSISGNHVGQFTIITVITPDSGDTYTDTQICKKFKIK